MGIPGLKKLLCDFRRHGICKAMELWQPNNTKIWHGYGMDMAEKCAKQGKRWKRTSKRPMELIGI